MQHVAEHLGIETACLVALAHAGIDARLASRGQVIGYAELGQQLGEMLAQAAAVVDVDVVAVKDFASGGINHSVAGVGLAVVVERGVLIVKSQPGSEGDALPVVARLVV